MTKNEVTKTLNDNGMIYVYRNAYHIQDGRGEYIGKADAAAAKMIDGMIRNGKLQSFKFRSLITTTGYNTGYSL